MSKAKANVTYLLQQGDWGKATPLIIEELRQITHFRLLYLEPGDSLDTHALIDEAHLKLIGQSHMAWQDRAHFCALASRAMRSILVKYAQKKTAQKRGGNVFTISLEEAGHVAVAQAQELIALDEALTRLAEINERQSKIFEYRFFGGFTIEEIADFLSISLRTVKRNWQHARFWLYRAMQNDEKTTDTSSGTEEIEQLPGVESFITLAYCDKPSIRLKGKIRSIQEGEANIAIPDEEWDTFYFED